jgi:hypothetical protein
MEDFEIEIDKVLSGEITVTNSHVLISPEEVNLYLQSEGLEQGNFDSNGWDWDFWMEYFKGDKKFILAGSGWYNKGLSFYSENND